MKSLTQKTKNQVSNHGNICSGGPPHSHFKNYCNTDYGVFKWGGTKLERLLTKNQHAQRKLLNFENWINGGLRSFKKSEF